MKHLCVLRSWPEDMDMLWIKFLSVFCSMNLSCSKIVHIDKKWRGHKFSELARFTDGEGLSVNIHYFSLYHWECPKYETCVKLHRFYSLRP